MKKIIDMALDTVAVFKDYPSTRLMRFDNKGHEDLRLVCRGRVLRVYLAEEQKTTPEIVEDCKELLKKIFETSSKK